MRVTFNWKRNRTALGNGDAHLRLVDITSDSDTAEVNLDRQSVVAELADDLHNDGVRFR